MAKIQNVNIAKWQKSINNLLSNKKRSHVIAKLLENFWSVIQPAEVKANKGKGYN